MNNMNNFGGGNNMNNMMEGGQMYMNNGQVSQVTYIFMPTAICYTILCNGSKTFWTNLFCQII